MLIIKAPMVFSVENSSSLLQNSCLFLGGGLDHEAKEGKLLPDTPAWQVKVQVTC